jgi:oligopeptidase A
MTTDESNPLLEVEFRIAFDRIRAEHVKPAVAVLLDGARARLEAIASLDEPRTFDNTLGALDLLPERLEYAMSVVHHLEAVATYPELREAFNTVQPEVSAFQAGIRLHSGLWNAIKAYVQTEEAAGLTGERKRFLVKTLDSFRRQGADLDSAGKKRLEALDVELATLTTKFSQNVLDSTNAYELVISDPASLAGLPPTALAAARESATRKGLDGWRFTLNPPDFYAVMTYLDDASVRRDVYRAANLRGTAGDWDNRPILHRILDLRREKAHLLGFPNFAEFVLEDRMAGSSVGALTFVEDLQTKTEAHFERENVELLEFRRSIEGPQAPELEPWDLAYYAEKQRAALYAFDEEALRPYFALERVTGGLFELLQRLYGIRVTEKQGVPVWDAHVRYYDVHDRDGLFLGGFYTDWFPRENKRTGAWMDALITGGPSPAGFKPHLGLVCGNLTPPVAGLPALLTHREVETIFHEFGHLMHHLLSRVSIRTLAGTNVAWDFVELPSQIMENWCWERESLDLFARHFETGAGIPDELFESMRRARTFRTANAQMRQLGFAYLDLLLHTRYSPEADGDAVDYTRAILQRFTPAKLPPDHAMIAAFHHLFGSPVGYGAGYYSYKWAEVLDADAFTRFREHGIFSPEVGAAFRERILERGDSADPAELYRSFMGRDPDPDALLERSGLTAPVSS